MRARSGPERVLVEHDGLRLLRLRSRDLGDLARWLSDPRVLQFYHGRDRPMNVDQVRRKYLHSRQDPASGRFFGYQACLVELERRPVGFAQFYRLPLGESTQWRYPPKDRSFAFDLFIGETELWGQGLGSRLVELLRDYLLRERKGRRIVLDPRVDNERAVHLYEKAGFRRRRRLPAREVHEGKACDCWLMEFP